MFRLDLIYGFDTNFSINFLSLAYRRNIFVITFIIRYCIDFLACWLILYFPNLFPYGPFGWRIIFVKTKFESLRFFISSCCEVDISMFFIEFVICSFWRQQSVDFRGRKFRCALIDDKFMVNFVIYSHQNFLTTQNRQFHCLFNYATLSFVKGHSPGRLVLNFFILCNFLSSHDY